MPFHGYSLTPLIGDELTQNSEKTQDNKSIHESTGFKIRVAIGFLLILGVTLPLASSNNPAKYFGLVPPLVALGIAILTGRVVLGLTMSIAAAGFLMAVKEFISPSAKAGSTVESSGELVIVGFENIMRYMVGIATNTWNLQILAFVGLIMATISVMVHGGGIRGVLDKLLVFANNRKSTLWITYSMGLVLFFDDYANTMIVGATARPLTDSYKVSREKLAFLVDATAAPMAGLAFVSTWIGYEVGLFGQLNQSLGLNTDGYSMFFDAIGYRFYCILMLIFIALGIFMNRDFGPMLTAEVNSLKRKKADDIDALENEEQIQEAYGADAPHQNPSMWVGIIPLVLLMGSIFIGLWYDGRENLGPGFNASPLSLEYWRDILGSAENSVTVFATAGILGFLSSTICSVFIGKIRFKYLMKAVKEGIKTAWSPTIVLILAWALKDGCSDLGTTELFGELVSSTLPAVSFPVVLFILSAAVAFSTGTSWGTMSLLLPIAVPIAYQFDGSTYGLLTMISLGSVLDGSIMGDHASPISDTTIMSAAGSNCDLMAHVRTQAPYSLTVGLIATITGYIPACFGISPIYCILVSCLFLFLVYKFFGKSPESLIESSHASS